METYKVASLAGREFDMYDDPSFLESPAVSKLIKAGKLLHPEELEQLSDSAFAVKIAGHSKEKRAYPIYNPTITKLSIRYFEKNASMFPMDLQLKINNSLAKAANYFKIEAPSKVKVASNEDPRRLIKMAMFKFVNECENKKPEEKMEAAIKIASYAKKTGQKITSAEVLSYVPSEKYGSYLQKGLEQREEIVARFQDAVLSETFAIVKEASEKVTADVFCDILKTFDKAFNFNFKYSDDLYDPIKTSFGVTKVADDEGLTAEKRVTGSKKDLYDVGEVKALPLDKGVSNVMGKQKEEMTAKLLHQVARLVTADYFGGSKYVMQQFQLDPVRFYVEAPAKYKKPIDDKMKELKEKITISGFDDYVN